MATTNVLQSPRDELVQLHHRIFKRNQRLIRSEAMVVEPGFSSYERRYQSQVAGYQEAVSLEELLKAIDQADIIYLGDYHTNPQSQRALLRILKLVTMRYPDIGLALELVQDAYQEDLDRYLQESISETTFLRRVKFKEFWYFDLWQNFKAIFDYARFHHMPIYGIESLKAQDKGLKRRDRLSGELIAKVVEENDGQKIFVFVGDLHIAPQHLPSEVDRSLKKKGLKRKKLIIYQNSEEIYWRLAEQKLEDKVEIVRLDKESYCLINTPPIVSQQTYLNWLENEGEAIDYGDAKHTLVELVERIAEFLEIALPDDADDLEVFTCGDFSFLEMIRENKSFSARELKAIKRQILSSESYFIPRLRTIYLANVSINHASEEAAHYLKFLCSGPEFPRLVKDAFYANILHEALGFFGSKIINPKRKCLHENNYMSLLDYLHSVRASAEKEIELRIAHLVLDHKKLERRGRGFPHQKILSHNPELFQGISHALGYMLGDRLYYAMIRGHISKKEMRDLFKMSMEEEGAPLYVYLGLLKKTKKVRLPKRM
jgi:hypothetical protein